MLLLLGWVSMFCGRSWLLACPLCFHLGAIDGLSNRSSIDLKNLAQAVLSAILFPERIDCLHNFL